MFDSLADYDFGVLYVVSQVFALLAMLFNLYAIQRKKKTQILNFNTIAAACGTLHYLFLGAWSGVATKAISTVRNGIAAYEAHRHKTSKIWPIVFVCFYIVGGIVTYRSPLSVLPVIAAATYAVVIYLGDARTIRYIAVFTSSLWVIYNALVFSVVGIISESIFVINALVAIYRYRGSRNNKRAKVARKATRLRSVKRKT